MIWLAIGAFAAFAVIALYACCVVSGRSDRDADDDWRWEE